jgi:hypothetical protein
MLSIYWPVDGRVDPRVLAIATLVPQALMIVLAVVAQRGRKRPALAQASVCAPAAP